MEEKGSGQGQTAKGANTTLWLLAYVCLLEGFSPHNRLPLATCQLERSGLVESPVAWWRACSGGHVTVM